MKHLITAMAFSRDKWIDRASKLLSGAVGEYAKQKLAELTDSIRPDAWKEEINALLKKVEELFDTKRVKTKSKFDLSKALAEAVMDSSTDQLQVHGAKNDMVNKYLNDDKEIKEFLRKYRSSISKFDVGDLLIDMLREYSPLLSEQLQKGIKD